MRLKRQRWLNERAEEARAHLENMKDPGTIEAMPLVIENYERLAKLAEAQEPARSD